MGWGRNASRPEENRVQDDDVSTILLPIVACAVVLIMLRINVF